MEHINHHPDAAGPTPLKLVLTRLPKAKRSGNSWSAPCPAHDDHSPSLSIREGNDGRVLLHCHAGCRPENILAAIGLTWSNLFADGLDAETKRGFLIGKALEKVGEVELVRQMAANADAPLSEEDQTFLDKKTREGERAKADLARLGAEPAAKGTETQGIYTVSSTGVRAMVSKDKDEPEIWLCSELRVLALTRNGESEDWGRLLEWKDHDDKSHRWVMPQELLQGDGNEILKELLRRGLQMGTGKKARDHLLAYLQTWKTDSRARCVMQPGWHGQAYVTPTEAIGSDEPIFFINNHAVTPCWSASGGLMEWQNLVAVPAVGNTRLVLALSIAFTGPLLHLVNEGSGGIHLRGSSSSGKSTALRMAASVWGNPEEYLRLWRATINALEGLATIHNDGVLILDELSQMRPDEAGDAAYLLANGQGKSRASRQATTRKVASWRLLFLSAGEISLAAHVESGGRRVNAGQELRMADVEVDAGKGMGILENLHAYDEPVALIDALNQASEQHYGVAGPEFLRQLTAHLPSLLERIQRRIKEFSEKHVPQAATSQARRVASRFASIAAAGELATSMGITGWTPGEAENAAAACFKSWLDNFGSGQMREVTMMLQRIRHLLQVDASRFESARDEAEGRVHNRAGYVRKTKELGKHYLVFPEVFRKEICDSLDEKQAIAHLKELGWLIPDKDRRNTHKPSIHGASRRVYVFSSKALEDEI